MGFKPLIIKVWNGIPIDFKQLDDLNRLSEIVVDKRLAKGLLKKRIGVIGNEKQFIKNAIEVPSRINFLLFYLYKCTALFI
jgi:hypothetical protein